MSMFHRGVGAGFAVAIVFAMTVPADAGREVDANDVVRLLTGKAFRIECADGTQGRGQISRRGVVNVSYRRPSETHNDSDNAVLRVRGTEICLAWKQFGGGGDGCYPVSEEARGRYRLGSGPMWCDISTR
jgi:hypothetical protein